MKISVKFKLILCPSFELNYIEKKLIKGFKTFRFNSNNMVNQNQFYK